MSVCTCIQAALHTMVPRRELDVTQSEATALAEELRALKVKLGSMISRAEYEALYKASCLNEIVCMYV